MMLLNRKNSAKRWSHFTSAKCDLPVKGFMARVSTPCKIARKNRKLLRPAGPSRTEKTIKAFKKKMYLKNWQVLASDILENERFVTGH
jgi:hypothetical protein